MTSRFICWRTPLEMPLTSSVISIAMRARSRCWHADTHRCWASSNGRLVNERNTELRKAIKSLSQLQKNAPAVNTTRQPKTKVYFDYLDDIPSGSDIIHS